MSHLRYDVATHDWVIFAPERAYRPHDKAVQPKDAPGTPLCPFCPGKEADTHDELLRIPDPAHPDLWSVRVVANKFPALSLQASGGFLEKGRHFQEYDGYGAHEVIIETPNHYRPLALQSSAQIERILI